MDIELYQFVWYERTIAIVYTCVQIICKANSICVTSQSEYMPLPFVADKMSAREFEREGE